MNRDRRLLVAASLIISCVITTPSVAQPSSGNVARIGADVARYWTPERRAMAVPRDLVLDKRGLGYMRRPDGSLMPYGHEVAALRDEQAPQGRPSGGGDDSTPPVIDEASMDPAAGQTIGASHTFSARVTDNSGLRSVSFVIYYPDGVTQQTFAASNSGGDVWRTTLQGFSNGSWSWEVVARDTAKRGGNNTTSSRLAFNVDTGGGSVEDPPQDPPGIITNAAWADGGPVQSAAGRIYFEMPSNKKWNRPWNGYVCSGTVVNDGVDGRSIILTAAHCIYDDVNKAFARNVLFIPNQAGTNGSATDLNCNNDPLGCWTPNFGVVDQNWTTRTFPDNVAWDYAYYVVDDSGSHQGTAASSDVLDLAAGSLAIDFTQPLVDETGDSDVTHALGYSYSEDPNFMFCAEDMTVNGSVNWWLPNCELSGGSSGGPWIQPMDIDTDGSYTGDGPVMSVNSWGYTSSPGMAGPRLNGTSAQCVFDMAKTGSPLVSGPGYWGIVTTCLP